MSPCKPRPRPENSQSMMPRGIRGFCWASEEEKEGEGEEKLKLPTRTAPGFKSPETKLCSAGLSTRWKSSSTMSLSSVAS